MYYRGLLQKCVFLISAKAEYFGLFEYTKAVLFLQRILNKHVKIEQTTSIRKHKSAWIKWEIFHPAKNIKSSKDIELRYYHIRDKIASVKIRVEKISSPDTVADFLMKVLASVQIREANDHWPLVDVKKFQRTKGTVPGNVW